MEKITDYLFAPIETEDGRKLGRIYEIRSAGEPEHGITHETRDASVLLYGRPGFWESLGFKQAALEGVSTDEIRRFENGKVIIAARPASEE